MQTIWQQLDTAFRTAIRDAFDGLDVDPLVSPAQNEKFGDYQANAAMSLAKLVTERTGQKTNPRQVAEQILAKLDLGGMSVTPPDKSWIAGPGFINVRLSQKWLSERLAEVAEGNRLGVEPAANPQTVVVDYSAPNIAKELHVGHLRSTIIGDAVSRILEFRGDKVVRQNHVGDWGTQFGMLIAFLKAEGDSAAGVSDLDRFYKAARVKFDSDPKFADEARQTVVRLQAGEAEERSMWERIVDATRSHFEPLYRQLNVKLSRADECGESFYNPMLPAVVDDLQAMGIAVPSEGAIAIFTPGEEAPLIVRKQDGGFGYATTDLAAIRYRVGTLRANRIIYFVGIPQAQHFRQVFDAARRACWAPATIVLEHAAFGSVLGEDRKMFRARAGQSVKLADLLNEGEQRGTALAAAKAAERGLNFSGEELAAIGHAVGIGAVKYADLSKDRLTDYVFSFDAMLATEGNTAPYIQYAYARVRSIFREAKKRGIPFAGTAKMPISLTEPKELALAKQVLRFGEAVEAVSRELKPHLLCAYLYELAGRYSSFYEACPVLSSEDPVRSSRLALADLTAQTLAKGLDLLGIEHPEQL